MYGDISKSWQHCLKAEKAAYYHCLIFLLSLQSLFLFSYMTVTRPDILRYQFVFWEDSKNSVSVPEISRFRMHVTVKEDGENLWTIAKRNTQR